MMGRQPFQETASIRSGRELGAHGNDPTVPNAAEDMAEYDHMANVRYLEAKFQWWFSVGELTGNDRASSTVSEFVESKSHEGSQNSRMIVFDAKCCRLCKSA